jgi:hypothetical protein
MFQDSSLTFSGQEWNTTGFNFQINNNCEPFWTTRYYYTQYPYLIQERKRNYNLGCSVILEDSSSAKEFYNHLKDGDLATLNIVMRNGSKTITIAASNCTVRNAPHIMPEVGAEVEIAAELVPQTCIVTTVDEIPVYTAF